MNTRKRKKKRPRHPAPEQETTIPGAPLLFVNKGGIGVDFSVPVTRVLAAPGGVSELNSAEIVALAYGLERHPDLGPLPSVSLVCRNVEKAKDAWEVFAAWEKDSDGDAVTLGWFFNRDGYYRLVVGADRDRLAFRLRGYETSMEDVVVSGYYTKRFDTVSEHTRQFRDYIRNRYAPFLFGACTEQMVPIGSSLLKLHATQADEDDLVPGSPERMILGLENPPKTQGKPQVDGASHRSKTMRRHFPVTLARLRRDDVGPILDTATAMGFQQWQIQQAAANLALSAELSPGRPHFAALPRHTAARAILEGLSSRHEMADGLDFASTLAEGRLIQQLVLDGNALLSSFGEPTSRSPEKTIGRLRKCGLLDTGHRGT